MQVCFMKSRWDHPFTITTALLLEFGHIWYLPVTILSPPGIGLYGPYFTLPPPSPLFGKNAGMATDLLAKRLNLANSIAFWQGEIETHNTSLELKNRSSLLTLCLQVWTDLSSLSPMEEPQTPT